jgi:uncharacterized integral membrane protein
MKAAGGRLAVNESPLYNDVESLSSVTALSPTYLDREGSLQEETSRSTRIRVAIASVLLVCILLVVIDSFTAKRVESVTLAFFGWVEANPFLGVLSVVLVYIIATSKSAGGRAAIC